MTQFADMERDAEVEMVVEKPAKKKRLTKKQRGFVKDYVATENGTQAALKNYDIESDKPEKVAASIATENLSKPEIIEAIEETKKGLAEYLPIETLARVHIQGLEATRSIAVGVGADATIDEVPDYAVRHKYLDSAYKIHGVYVTEPEKIGHGNTYNFFYKPEIRATTNEYEEKVKKLLYEEKTEAAG